MTTSTVKTSQTGELLVIQLDRPSALNALNLDMLEQLKSILVDAFTDETVNSIWLESTSTKAFCAGGDVKALTLKLAELALPLEKSAIGKHYFALEYAIDKLIDNSPKPIVAFAQGLVYGGGWGLFAGANLKLCSERASFAMPEIQIGFYPDVGAAHFLQKSNWRVGTLLGLSGISISAKEAMALGYVDDIISSDYADVLKKQLADGIDVTELDIASADRDLDDIHEHWMAAIAMLPTDAALNDWIYIAEQNPTFSPFKRAAQAWVTGSPWSVAFTWHYFQRMRGVARTKVLDADTNVGAFFCTFAEFQEGVQAKLVDKNRTAQWMYPQVESVPLHEILKAIE